MKWPSYKNFFTKVKTKDIYFIWVRLKSRKAELKQQVKTSLAKYVTMFRHDCSYNIKICFQTQNHTISEFQRIKAFQTLH